MTTFIDVAAAAIVNVENEVLIAKRAAHRHQGDRWEFPGGKLESNETAGQALVRELQEELGITPTQFRPLIQIRHHYADKSVCLHVFRVDAFTGTPHGHEGQPLAWVPTKRLDDYAFPAANLPIIAAVQLPDRLLITPEPDDRTCFLNAIERACLSGIRLLQLRAHTVSDDEYRALALAVNGIASAHGCALMLNRDPRKIADLPCDGWHLSGHVVEQLSADFFVTRPRWLSASCHSANQLQRAMQLPIDFLLVSPVAKTQSHPTAEPLGWSGFAELAGMANRPVYALGGMSARDIEQSWQNGGQGIAAIRALWPV